MEVADTPTSLRIQVVSDGRIGMENQALGLAEAVQRLFPSDIRVNRIRWKPAFDKWPSALKTPAMLAPNADNPFPPKGEAWPDLWIATGRATLPLSARVRGLSGGKTFVVQTQDPRWNPGAFDLIVAPRHDQLEGANVLSITGSPHRITSERMFEAATRFPDLARLPQPRVAVLIGGRSRSHDLTPDHARHLALQVRQAIFEAGGALMLTFSRRTPEAARIAMTEVLSGLPGQIWDGTGDNPMLAFLHFADHILVTEDSANMATEAASTSKPVHILPMVARGKADKFNRLQADLFERRAARPFSGKLDGWAYSPLAETERAAQDILVRMADRRAAQSR